MQRNPVSSLLIAYCVRNDTWLFITLPAVRCDDIDIVQSRKAGLTAIERANIELNPALALHTLIC